MFTYFLVDEDSNHRLRRLSTSLSASSRSSDGQDVKEQTDTTTVALVDGPPEPVKPAGDRGWPAGPAEPRRRPTLPRYNHGRSCDLAMELIFPNFQRSLAASSRRRRFRHRSTTDAGMSNSLHDSTEHDAVTAAKDNAAVGAVARHKDFRIPKSSILESASEGEFRVDRIPIV